MAMKKVGILQLKNLSKQLQEVTFMIFQLKKILLMIINE